MFFPKLQPSLFNDRNIRTVCCKFLGSDRLIAKLIFKRAQEVL
ncbi:hypothetical protein [Methanolobus psychrotolerans]|nr:hypothetical protein [Methanolobus psychrotolerans]